MSKMTFGLMEISNKPKIERKVMDRIKSEKDKQNEYNAKWRKEHPNYSKEYMKEYKKTHKAVWVSIKDLMEKEI